MEDQDYMDADFEVICMVNRGRGNGGQLPGKAIRYIPEKRADAIIALDRRIEKLKKAAPYIGAAAAFLLGLIL